MSPKLSVLHQLYTNLRMMLLESFVCWFSLFIHLSRCSPTTVPSPVPTHGKPTLYPTEVGCSSCYDSCNDVPNFEVCTYTSGNPFGIGEFLSSTCGSGLLCPMGCNGTNCNCPWCVTGCYDVPYYEFSHCGGNVYESDACSPGLVCPGGCNETSRTCINGTAKPSLSPTLFPTSDDCSYCYESCSLAQSNDGTSYCYTKNGYGYYENEDCNTGIVCPGGCNGTLCACDMCYESCADVPYYNTLDCSDDGTFTSDLCYGGSICPTGCASPSNSTECSTQPPTTAPTTAPTSAPIAASSTTSSTSSVNVGFVAGICVLVAVVLFLSGIIYWQFSYKANPMAKSVDNISSDQL